MSKYILVMLFVLATLPFRSVAEESEWIVATEAMRDYCMAEVCLGMTVNEVSKLPDGNLTLWESSQWKRNCTGAYGEWGHAYFTTKDGTKLIVGFRDFPGSAEAKLRFRVQSVALYVEATRDEFNLLREKLTSRYDMQRKMNEVIVPIEEWSVPNSFFDTVVNASFEYLPRKSLLTLSANVDHYPDWMRGQPQCKGRNPVLPKI